MTLLLLLACSLGVTDPVDTEPVDTALPAIGGPVPCEGGESLLQDGPAGLEPTGWERCADGRVHRVFDAPCRYVEDNPDAADCDPPCGEDAYCGIWDMGSDGRRPGCEPKTCPSGVRLCDGPDSTCIGANCATDADCGEGYLCLLQQRPGNCAPAARLACESAADTCRSHDACPSGSWCLWRSDGFACWDDQTECD